MNIALDTNLLLLFIVGSVRPDFIPKHRRLGAYGRADFELLLEVVSKADTLCTTPNTLTETSNLLGYGVTNPLRAELMTFFAQVIGNAAETYVKSARVAANPRFFMLGLSDATWIEALDGKAAILLTADLGLYLAASHQGLSAINFTHLREQRGFL
jgi:hypothetical protein